MLHNLNDSLDAFGTSCPSHMIAGVSASALSESTHYRILLVNDSCYYSRSHRHPSLRYSLPPHLCHLPCCPLSFRPKPSPQQLTFSSAEMPQSSCEVRYRIAKASCDSNTNGNPFSRSITRPQLPITGAYLADLGWDLRRSDGALGHR
jgi:hypothetical protein